MPNEIGLTLPNHQSQTNLLEMLFERMPMGVAVLDRQLRIQRYNPTWGEFAARYAPQAGVPLAPGVGYFEHLPGSESFVQPLLNAPWLAKLSVRMLSAWKSAASRPFGTLSLFRWSRTAKPSAS
ncbi:MAG: hypothetical protein ACUVR4_15010 [Anaerolineae bacterium]